MNKFGRLRDTLRSSFWFVPSLMVGGSVVLAAVLIELDSTGSDEWLAQWPRLFGAGAEGARGMMSTIASSMMTVVGVTFSMILVVLALASSQYTSRVLRNFIRSRVTQFVLGTFAGIFAYCLIVLRTIRGTDASAFVPALAVFFGFVLALCGVSALMFFIHHIASSIQASSIIATIADATMLAIDRLFPERLGQEPSDDDEQPAILPLPRRSWQSVPARGDGYIENVDGEALLRFAREHKTIVRMERGIGDFVVDNTPLVSLALEDPPDAELIDALQSVYHIDRHRTLEQDAAFGIRQIVDMALRALSPSTNDTTTAVMCVDYLTAILSRLASRSIPSSHRFEDGDLRVISNGPTFAKLVAESFDQIRGSAGGNVGIMLRMLGALQTIGSLTASPSRRRALREQVQWIAELAERTVQFSHERSMIDARLTRAREALEDEPASSQHEGDGMPSKEADITPVRLYYIRHGETEWSLSGQHTGRTDLPLTAHGEDEARELGGYLQDVRFAHVLTSPLVRARRTCELVGLGKVAKIEPDLAEWDYGDYEGQRSVEIRKGRPDWNVFRDGCPHGEMPAQISSRADRLSARLSKLDGNVALFSHGQLGGVLAACWIGLTVVEGQHFPLDTASVSIFSFDSHHPTVPVIALWNVNFRKQPLEAKQAAEICPP